MNLDNNDHLNMIRHFGHQTGSTPVHLDNDSVKGLRNLHHLVHNEDVEHDFSKLKTLFAQPNIAIHLKSQLEKKKANGGVINDYINTLKHNGSGENSELSLVPDELVKFLDDSYSLGTTNAHTGHKEYHLGNMFDGLNNAFRPIKDSMRKESQTSTPPQMLNEMSTPPREGHAYGDIVGDPSQSSAWGLPSLSGVKNAAYNAASGLGNAAYGAAQGLGNAAYNAASYVAPKVGNAAYSVANDLYKGTGNAYGLGDIYNVGKAAYGAFNNGNSSSMQGNEASKPGLIQNVMRGIAAPIGGAIGGLGGQFVGQKVGQNLAAGIPLIGHLAAPIAGNIAGNMAYNAAASKGRNKGIELADNFYNYIGGGGGNAPGINSNPQNPNQSSNSKFPSFSGIGNKAYDAASNFGNAAYNAASGLGNAAYGAAQGLGNAAYGLGKKVYDTTSTAASNLGNNIYSAGNAAYNKLPTIPRFNKTPDMSSTPPNNIQVNPQEFADIPFRNINLRTTPTRNIGKNPFDDISSSNVGRNPFASTNPFD
jgi:hypothetical protein